MTEPAKGGPLTREQRAAIAVVNVMAAYTGHGVDDETHERRTEALHQQWPELAAALDDMLEVTYEDGR